MKSLITITLLGSLIAAYNNVQQDPKPYKNLQVLPQNISDSEMTAVMQHFNKSLGVKCNYCHVKDPATDKFDFASDSKVEKLIARKMFTMTDSINHQFFPSGKKKSLGLRTVSCYTCHQGNEMPLSINDTAVLNIIGDGH